MSVLIFLEYERNLYIKFYRRGMTVVTIQARYANCELFLLKILLLSLVKNVDRSCYSVKISSFCYFIV